MSAPWVSLVDWGTTSFRAWLVDADGQVLATSRSDEGMKQAMDLGFASVLEKHLHEMSAPVSLPVVMCGMVGSRQGWQEARYLDVPVTLDDLVERSTRLEYSARNIHIMPGIAQRTKIAPDVMRGEETQLLGAYEGGEVRFCMPGTHAKWVEIDDGTLRHFTTYLSGELFEILSSHSILTHTVSDQPLANGDDPSFLQGVRDAMDRPSAVSSMLFRVRADSLLNSAVENPRARLSGLLIGLELADQKIVGGETIHLLGNEKLNGLYAAALKQAGAKTIDHDAEKCVRDGLMRAATILHQSAMARRKA